MSGLAAILLAASVPAALVALFLGFAGLVAPRGVMRRRITCPVQGREALVDFVLAEGNGDVYRDVVDCPLVGPGHEIDCGKPCRSLGVAPFGTSRLR
jgi:hypothetical protein